MPFMYQPVTDLKTSLLNNQGNHQYHVTCILFSNNVPVCDILLLHYLSTVHIMVS